MENSFLVTGGATVITSLLIQVTFNSNKGKVSTKCFDLNATCEDGHLVNNCLWKEET